MRPRTVRPELSRASWRRTRKRVRQRDGDRCQVCGSDGWIPPHLTQSGRFIAGRRRLVVGHITPAERYAGHHDDPRNLRTMCVSCNNSQRDLSDEQWRTARASRGQTIGTIRADYSRRTILPTRARAL
jgi:5-methylcytosine-specific restriction endonuclease McrA